MNRVYGTSTDRAAHGRPGFSLAEMLAAVVLGAMVLVAVLGIYGQANRAAEAVMVKTESSSLAAEVLQLIAADLNRTLGAEDVTLRVRNGFDQGFARAELVLRRTFHDSENKELTLEEIIWRAAYDPQGETPGLILYRSYEGIAPEDKLLDDYRESWEKNYPFIPVCRGLSFFRIQACKGDDLLDQWATPSLPPGVKVTLSFAAPYDTVQGTYDVLDNLKVSRIIALDTTRNIKFTMNTGPAEPNESADANQPAAEKPAPSDEPSRPGAPGARAPSSQERRSNDAPTRQPPGRATRSR
jgi:prepilin-type N-terminal cleavage/methylation domain-containing protein